MRRTLLALVAVFAGGCAMQPAPPVASVVPVAPTAPQPPSLLADARFPAPSERIDGSDLFVLSDAMKAYLRDVIEPKVAANGRQRALVDALYNKSELRLAYDSTMTRNAEEAFAARAGNCLSLVIMTAAFAKALDLGVTYQKVMVDDAIGRDGDIYFAIGHVNLTLARHLTDEMGYGFRTGKKRVEPDRMTIDFLPPEDLRSVKTRTIEEDTVVAMYLNNRAVETLAHGDVVDAYWWARAAVTRDPTYLPAVNTLGVVYARHHDAAEAERALRHVLDREPGNTLAMSNLVEVLAESGRTEESRRLAATLARIDPEPPFSWYIRGMEALRRNDFRTAKDAFAREVARAPDFHEFHFWLAISLVGLGEKDAARDELELALENSTTRRDHDVYAAKLAKLTRESQTIH